MHFGLSAPNEKNQQYFFKNGFYLLNVIVYVFLFLCVSFVTFLKSLFFSPQILLPKKNKKKKHLKNKYNICSLLTVVFLALTN